MYSFTLNLQWIDVTDLAPGNYRVKTTLPSGEELAADVTLSAGETRELTLP